MLHLNTVSITLLEIIQRVSQKEEFSPFRLVGGTALSLYLGHRISIDADFFTEKPFDKKLIESYLVEIFPSAIKVSETTYGFTWVYENVKMDLYDWKVPFINPPFEESSMRLASIEDIAAYKLEAIVGRKTEKDFRDVAELLSHFSFSQLLEFYRKKYPYSDLKVVLENLAGFNHVPQEPDIVLFKEQSWFQVQQIISNAMKNYFDELNQKKERDLQEREERIRQILSRKNKE
jgi:hypothetical protein